MSSFFDWVRGVPKPAPAPAPDVPAVDELPVPDAWGGSGLNVRDRLKAFTNLMPETVREGGGLGVAMDSADNDGMGIKGMIDQQPALSDALYMWFARQGFIGHQMAALTAQHWLIAKACNMPARDSVRNGWRVTSADGQKLPDDVVTKIAALDRKFKIKQQLLQYLTLGRTFGIRIALADITYDDPVAAYEAPFNIDGVTPGSFKGWTQIDPYWVAPELDADASSNPASRHFYEPTWWVIDGKRYHRTHLIIYRHGELADILKPAYLYGGIPIPQLIMERVYAAERSANEAPLLALSKRTVVYKTDISKAIANWDKFNERLEIFSQLWNNKGIRVIDKLADEHQQFDTALADLDALIMTQYQLVAAIAEVPATKLLGTSAKGFNATGEHDESNYHESLESIQENDLQPFLERHYMLLCASAGIEVQIEPVWNPLDAMTSAERAAANLAKSQAAAALVAGGIISSAEERTRLARDIDGDYTGVVDVEEDNDGIDY